MRSLTPELPDTLTRTPAARAVPTAFDWDATAMRVAGSRDRGEILTAVAQAADRLGFSAPDVVAPLVVLQREFGRLHRAAINAW